MTKHTPSPWHRNIKPASKYPTIWAGRNTHVAAILPGAPRGSGDGCTMSEEEQEANICLITAAPDMLDAVKDYAGALDYYIRKDERSGDIEGANLKRITLSRVDAIIAKAEGRS